MKLLIKRFEEAFSKRALRIEKRYRFVASALILTAVMTFSTFSDFGRAIFFIPLFIVLVYVFTYFSVLEGVEKIEWLMLFLMPLLVTVSFYLFYFLFPGRWLTRFPFMILYAVSIYAILLCSNIFNVGVEKSLQLYRAAFSVNFFFQTIIGFFLFNTLFSSRFAFLLNAFIVSLTVFLMAMQLIWTLRLNLRIEKEILLFALLTASIVGQLALVVSFIPMEPAISALFLTASYYSLSGLIFNYLDQRLFKETVREYLTVWVVVLAISLLSLRW